MLIGANVVLVAALAMCWPTKSADAQFGAAANFSMIAGRTLGRQEEVLYITELSSGRMITVIFNGSNKRFEEIAGVDMKKDFAKPAGGPRR
jgi:hypothetical protein